MRRLTAAAAALALALAGCGGDGDDDGTPGDTGAATTDVPLTGTIGGTTTGDDGETGTDDD
jgi:ABC-type glycerol-3-phosphate transport system substrate-binding protein